jgi:RNA polymerase sigma factor (TIGR02999 family)
LLAVRFVARAHTPNRAPEAAIAWLPSMLLERCSPPDPSFDRRRQPRPAHFFGAAVRAMREVLVDFARRRKAAKRGGDMERVSLGEADGVLDMQLDENLALDAALDQLNAVNERLRQIVELRFFGGLGQDEVAEILGVTTRTVERSWLRRGSF